jgi:hypothetical protein
MPDMSTLTTLAIILSAGFIALLVITLIALLVPRLISARRLDSRAKHDYRVARGTQHRKQLERPLLELTRDIIATEEESQRAKRALSQLGRTRRLELRGALCRYLVTERLTEVHGIGPRLQQRIMKECFRGDIRDLRHAEKLSNIGPTRQAALSRWVQARERELPRLLETTFPGKEAIIKRYRDRKTALEKRLDRAREQLAQKRALQDPAETARNKLKSVHVSDFRKALRASSPDSHVPDWYLTGIYAPWESPPDWFITLLERYGG